MRTYRQIVAKVTERWDGWRIVDVDTDEIEDFRDELAERGLAASTLNQRRAVLSGIFKGFFSRLSGSSQWWGDGDAGAAEVDEGDEGLG
jgi:hypothetical protein